MLHRVERSRKRDGPTSPLGVRNSSARISCFHHSHTHEVRVRSTKMRTRNQMSIVSSTHGISLEILACTLEYQYETRASRSNTGTIRRD